jgi:hypothetical protein
MKFSVTGTVQGGVYLGEVEAESPEQAEKLGWALPNAYIILCHECAHKVEDLEITEIHVAPAS